MQQLDFLPEFKVNRCVKPNKFGQPVHTEMHYFADASTKGCGVCAYIRMINAKGEIHCSLIMAKAKVAPLKASTTPRLELKAAVMAAELSATLKRELQMPITQEYFWSDSTVVLGYITNESKRFHIFVANRVQRIKKHNLK